MSRKPKAGTHLARMLDREYAAELGRLYLLNNQDDLHPALRGGYENPEPSECDPPFDPGVVTRDLQEFSHLPVDGHVLALELRYFAYHGTFSKDLVHKRIRRVGVALQFAKLRKNGKTYEEAIQQCAEFHGASETTVRTILNDPKYSHILETVKPTPSPRRKRHTAD